MAKKSSKPPEPKQHWEKHYDPTPRGSAEDNHRIRNWDPMPSNKRPCTHVKINEADH